MRSTNKENFFNETTAPVDKNELWQLIERDNRDELKAWLKENSSLISSGALNKKFFLDSRSPYLEVPIFATIINKKYNAFIFLIEDAQVDILAKDAANRTVMDALCDSKWIKGLDYMIEKRKTIITQIKERYGGQNLKILRDLTLRMSKNYSENNIFLLIIDRLLQLDNAELLFTMKIGNQTRNFLKEISDKQTREEAEKLVKKHKLKLPDTQPIENRQTRVETAQQEKQGAGIYSFFSWVQSAVWVGSTQTALPAAAQHSEKTPASSNKSEKREEYPKNNGQDSRFFDKERAATGLRHRVKTEENQPLLKKANSQVSVH